MISVLREEEVPVDPMHTEQSNKEAGVADDIVNNNVQDKDSCRRKGIKSRNVLACIEDPRNSSDGKYDEISTTGGVGKEIGGQENLVVTGDVTSNECFEQRGKDAMANHFLERIKDEFMSPQSKLAVATCLFIKCTGNTFFELTTRIGNVSTIISNVVEMD